MGTNLINFYYTSVKGYLLGLHNSPDKYSYENKYYYFSGSFINVMIYHKDTEPLDLDLIFYL